jgi:succinoglycan biosynthesis protein ExoA
MISTCPTRPATLPLARPLPFISVVVPVRNEAAHLPATLAQLLGQDYPRDRFEVLVADGRSTDTTPDLVRALAARHPNLRLLDNPGRLSSAGRNRAIEAARGDIVVVIDGHCDLQNPHYLRDLAGAFDRSGADCVGRPQPLDLGQATPLQRAIAVARSSRLGHQPDSHIYSDAEGFVPPESVAVAYRRSVFAKVGLFDEDFDACEDVEFNHRVALAGLHCFFTPRVKVHYHPRATLGGLFGQLARYGRGRVRLLRKHPDTFSIACFVPGAFLLGLVVGPLLALLSTWLLLAYAGVVSLYALAVAVACLGCAAGTRDRALLPWLPLVFVTIHLGAGWGIVTELLAGWRRRPAGVEPQREAPAQEERRAA